MLGACLAAIRGEILGGWVLQGGWLEGSSVVVGTVLQGKLNTM